VTIRILATVLLAYLLSACAPVMDAAFQTARTGFQRAPAIDSSRLNPKIHYLRVTAGKRVAFLGLGFIDSDLHGRVEVWYSGEKETIRIQNGRVVGAAGLQTEWRGVVVPDFPQWSAIAQSVEPFRWVRVRDVMPGYRFGVRDALSVRVIPVPEKSALLDFDPKYLTWFEERIEAKPFSAVASLFSSASSNEPVLPPARYAVDMRDGGDTVVYAEQCLSAEFCFSWQRWDFHMQQQKP
jgi:hypothetical protein